MKGSVEYLQREERNMLIQCCTKMFTDILMHFAAFKVLEDYKFNLTSDWYIYRYCLSLR